MNRALIDGIEKSKIVFIDCFDTWLYRLIKPNEVFDIWFRLLSTDVGVDSELLSEMWSRVRETCKPDNGLDEPTFRKRCNAFYRRITKLKAIKYNTEEFFELCKDKMLLIELYATVIDDNLISYLQEKKKEGKMIICITDFYLPLETMSRLFERKNVNIFDRIYVSSEIGYRKSTGRLYDYVIRDVGIDNLTDIVMIGDNKRSDIIQSESKGIKAIRYSNKHIINSITEIIYYELLKVYQTNIESKDDFANYCFSLFAFSERLYHEVDKKGIKKLYFLSREGKPLKELFDHYLYLNGLSLETEYLYVSRKSTYLPSLVDLSEETFDALRKQVSDCSLRSFFRNISIKENELPISITAKYDIDSQIKDFFYSEIFKDVMSDSDFVNLYNKKRKEAKKEIMNYFSSVGLNSKENIGIVDVGWKGTIQDNIEKILCNKKIHGFYYGLNGDVENANNKYGLIFSDIPFGSEYFEIYKIQARMLERILAADHGSCEAYKDGSFVLNSYSDNDRKLFEHVRQTQKNIMTAFDDINLIVKREHHINPIILERAFAAMHMGFVLDIDRNRVKMMNRLYESTEENFGNFVIGNQDNDSRIGYIKSIANNPPELLQKALIILSKGIGIPVSKFFSLIMRRYYSMITLNREYKRALFLRLEELYE